MIRRKPRTRPDFLDVPEYRPTFLRAIKGFAAKEGFDWEAIGGGNKILQAQQRAILVKMWQQRNTFKLGLFVPEYIPASHITVGQVLYTDDGQIGRITSITPGSSNASVTLHYTLIDTANGGTAWTEYLKTDLVEVVA